MTDPSTFYDNITLTEEELKEAIVEGKKRKYFKEKNKEYWQSQEKENKPNHEKQISIPRI